MSAFWPFPLPEWMWLPIAVVVIGGAWWSTKRWPWLK